MVLIPGHLGVIGKSTALKDSDKNKYKNVDKNNDFNIYFYSDLYYNRSVENQGKRKFL